MDKRVKRAGKQAPKKRPYKHASIKQPTWQNPLLEYWSAHHHRFRPLRHLSRQARLEYRILAMLSFFSLSIGLWENFRQLWLQSNAFSPLDVSNITSLGMVVSILGIIIVGKTIKMPRIKTLMTTTLAFRSLNMIFLAILNHTGSTPLICISVVLDIVTGALIVTSVYPLLTTVMKSNHAYSRRKLAEYLFRDLGVLVGGVIIGQQIGSFIIDYNVCLLVAMLFSAIAGVIMWRFPSDKHSAKPIPHSSSSSSSHLTPRPSQPARITPQSANSLAPATHKFSAFRYIMHSRIQRLYMVYVFVAGAAYNAAIGLRMLVLTDYFDLSASVATNYLLIVGLASDALGILALRHFTPKSDYASVMIKYGTRIGLFACAFITGNMFLCFLSLTWALLSSTAYENVTDGHYINAVDNRHQLEYNTLKYVVNYAGDALGVFLCGQMFGLGVGYIFGMSGLLVIIQVITAFRLIKERKTYGFRRR